MIDIQIDQYIPQALESMFTADMLEGVLDNLADGAQAKWRQLARERLNSMREDYINGIQPQMSGPGVRVIVLVGKMPNAVEQGMSAYDMRETLLGPNSKIRRPSFEVTSKRSGGRMQDGWYANVPFRHKTPGASSMGGQPMGSAYGPRSQMYSGTIPQHFDAAGAREMGESVYQMARSLKRSMTPEPGARTQWGGRLPTGLAPILRPPREDHPVPQMRRGHVTDIYAGMVRIRHTYAKATQTQYMTWRRISTRVQDGWIHPGIRARHLAAEVEEWIRSNVSGALNAALRTASREAAGGAA